MYEQKVFTPIAVKSRKQLTPVWMEAIVDGPCGSFVVPTEARLYPGSGVPCPDLGRYYHAPHELGRDTRRDAEGKVEFESSRYIVEVMEDCGDDGHLEYRCVGWALVTSEMLSDYCEAVRAATCGWQYPHLEMHYEQD